MEGAPEEAVALVRTCCSIWFWCDNVLFGQTAMINMLQIQQQWRGFRRQ